MKTLSGLKYIITLSIRITKLINEEPANKKAIFIKEITIFTIVIIIMIGFIFIFDSKKAAIISLNVKIREKEDIKKNTKISPFIPFE